MKRHAVILICLFLVFLGGVYAEQPTNNSFELTVSQDSVAVKNGQVATVNIHIDAPENEAFAITASCDNKNICSATLGSRNQADNTLTITGKAAGVCKVSVHVKGHSETTKTILVTVYMSPEERKKSESIKYLTDSSFSYDETSKQYALFFGFRDKNGNLISAPAKVDIKITNSTGDVVFEDIRYVTINEFSMWSSYIYGDRYLAAVYVDPKSISESTNSSGTVTYRITSGNLYFDAYTIPVLNLPIQDPNKHNSLQLPTLPYEVEARSFSSDIESKVIINNIDYRFSNTTDGLVNLTIYYTGQKTFDSKGENNNPVCRIGWKLYDSDGFVIKSGVCTTMKLQTGERFRNYEDTIYDLKAGSYSIKLINVE